MRLRACDFELRVTDCATRIPFGFAGTEVREVAQCTVRVEVETEGAGSSTGFASDLLMPGWFDKSETRPVEAARVLAASAQSAGEAWCASERPFQTLFDSWWDVYLERVGRDPEPVTGLVAGFGVALLERALIDAVCRATDAPFFDALVGGAFGIQPERVHSELRGWSPAESLPPSVPRLPSKSGTPSACATRCGLAK